MPSKPKPKAAQAAAKPKPKPKAAQAAAKPKRTRGRPVGSQTEPRVFATAAPSRCPRCGSTNRDPYTKKTEQAHAGIDRRPDGGPFTHIVRRWTRCADCGQCRIDRTLENRPPATGGSG